MSASLQGCDVEGNGGATDVTVPPYDPRLSVFLTDEGQEMGENGRLIDQDFVCHSDADKCLEKHVLLNEIRADALRAAGLYDMYIVLCQRALQQVGTFEFHERVFNSFTLLACDEAHGYRVNCLRNAAACERLRSAIESEAMADYEARFGVQSHDAAVVNVRSECCNGIWHAVVIDGLDRRRVSYRVEFTDDHEFTCVFLDECDVEMDGRFSVIEDISGVAES